MYTVLIPGLLPPTTSHDQERMNRGPGLYAVPVLPYVQPVAGFQTNTLIPFTYNIPTYRSVQENREGGAEQVQVSAQPQLQQQQAGHQPQRRVVVRRFQIAFQLDLFLILKLAAVIFLFNQDGSKQRLALLVFLASLVYLYQTGALAPVIRWLSQGMQRPPPQVPRAAAAAAANRPENVPAVGAPGNENVAGEEERILNNDPAGEQHEVAGNRWWTIVKEIRLFVFGFITSLLPGFHHVD
ncbi:hypothetical protein M569_02701 [Genlisea aurea]|uniref:Transmembrane protein n=1 Tax=Genlisea aurea TaxID=192259 RepID=S8D3R8_9LAMI|nr:hypothetical protein M569_02701 [Genlisea aurea]